MDRWVGWPPDTLGVKREGSQKLREAGSQLGFQITKWYPSVVHSMLRHFASCFSDSPCSVHWVKAQAVLAVGVHPTKALPGVGPRQCAAAGMCTKALWWWACAGVRPLNLCKRGQI